MKQYISTNWKKILYVICGLIILINLVLTLRTPNKIIDDYYEYGPKYDTSIIDINADGEIADEFISTTAERTHTNFDTAKLIVIFIFVFIGCLVVDDIVQNKEAKKK